VGRVRNRRRLLPVIIGGLLALFLTVTACDNTLLWDRVRELAFMGWWDEGSWDTALFGD
jgi:hypothetical protein